MSICNRRDAGRPRRFRMRNANRSAPAVRVRRSGAGDGVAASAVDRHKTAKTDCPSAATCRRRNARASMPASGQASRPAKPPHLSNCSTHQAPCLPGWITSRRSGATPAAAQAGACGSQGGATKARRPPSPDSRASAGSSRLISPMPLRSTRISVRFPRGQPPPGSSASSSAWPLAMVPSGKPGKASPRQMSPRARTAAKFTGDGCALMTVSKWLRGSGRRQHPRWRIRLRRG